MSDFDVYDTVGGLVIARRFYRPGEVAAMLGISRPVIYRLIAAQQVRVVSLGRRAARIPPEEVARLASEGIA